MLKSLTATAAAAAAVLALAATPVRAQTQAPPPAQAQPPQGQAAAGPPRPPSYPVEAKGTKCPRAQLKSMVDAYSAALAAHDPSKVKLASGVRFTENGEKQRPGKSTLWKGAGAWGEENYLIDTERCGAVAFGVINENGRLVHFAVRLQTNASGAISEIEHVVGREKDFAYKPENILETKYLDWQTVLAPEERQSRAAMAAAATDYFAMFTKEPYVSVPFADRCDRWENGAHTTPSHNCSPKGLVIDQPEPRTPLADLETGEIAAFEHFTKSLADVHVFKMSKGKVNYIMAVVGPKSPDPWVE
jgi:hypothetical protein